MENDILSKLVQKNKLSLGIVFPIESYSGAIPKMENQEHLAKLAEKLGYKSLWFRDVPFHDPNFGDVGQIFDPFIYMTHIMNQTNEILLGTGSIILPLRHPIHIAKSVHSLQVLSGERIVLGIASGDRPIEYPAFGQDVSDKSKLFRDSFTYLKKLNEDFPYFQSEFFGTLSGQIDLLPKVKCKIPYFVTGHSGQSLDWIAEHADGWLYYPRDIKTLQFIMRDWKESLSKSGYEWKPFLQSLYIDLVADRKAGPKPIHLGFQSGIDYLKAFLQTIKNHGVNHVILNFKFNQRPIEEVMQEIAEEIIR